MVEQRLDEIYRLKQKYGGTIPEILAYLEKITAELDTLENADDRRGRTAGAVPRHARGGQGHRR